MGRGHVREWEMRRRGTQRNESRMNRWEERPEVKHHPPFFLFSISHSIHLILNSVFCSTLTLNSFLYLKPIYVFLASLKHQMQESLNSLRAHRRHSSTKKHLTLCLVMASYLLSGPLKSQCPLLIETQAWSQLTLRTLKCHSGFHTTAERLQRGREPEQREGRGGRDGERGERWDWRREAFSTEQLITGITKSSSGVDRYYIADVSDESEKRREHSFFTVLAQNKLPPSQRRISNISTHVMTGKDRSLNLRCDLIDSCGFHCLTKRG